MYAVMRHGPAEDTPPEASRHEKSVAPALGGGTSAQNAASHGVTGVPLARISSHAAATDCHGVTYGSDAAFAANAE